MTTAETHILTREDLLRDGDEMDAESFQAIIDSLKACRMNEIQNMAQLAAHSYAYTPANLLFLQKQARTRGITPLFYASYSRWQNMGKAFHGKPYQVYKGADSFWVWGPDKRKNKKSGQEEFTGRYFLRPVHADTSILQGMQPHPKTGEMIEHPPLPQFSTLHLDETEAQRYFIALHTALIMEGWEITEEQFPMDKLSLWTQYRPMQITLNSVHPPTLKFLSLAQAHILHQLQAADVQTENRESLICFAILAAHITGLAFGIDHEINYRMLEPWAESIKDTATLKGDLYHIGKQSSTLIKRIRKIMDLPALVVDADEAEEPEVKQLPARARSRR